MVRYLKFVGTGLTYKEQIKGISDGTGITEEQIKGIFKRYDANHDGFLNREEIRNAFESLGSRLPGYRAGRGLQHADTNGDGLIDNEELNALVQYGAKIGYTIE